MLLSLLFLLLFVNVGLLVVDADDVVFALNAIPCLQTEARLHVHTVFQPHTPQRIRGHRQSALRPSLPCAFRNKQQASERGWTRTRHGNDRDDTTSKPLFRRSTRNQSTSKKQKREKEFRGRHSTRECIFTVERIASSMYRK